MKKLMTLLIAIMILNNAQAATQVPVQDRILTYGAFCVVIQNSAVTVYHQSMWILELFSNERVVELQENGVSQVISEDGRFDLQVNSADYSKNTLVMHSTQYGRIDFKGLSPATTCPYATK